MAMEEILDSVRRIVQRWVITSSPLVSDATVGDTILNVETTSRFKAGDEVILRTSTRGETPLVIDSIIDSTHLELTSAIRFNWSVDDNTIVEKTFYQNWVQGLYLGEPENIPKFPAITINAVSRSSEWLTLDSTKENYEVQLKVYVQNTNQESTYRALLQIVDVIQKGLKANIYPLVGPYNVTTLTSDASSGDTYLKVSDSSIFDADTTNRLLIEDIYKAQENRVVNVVDGTTIELAEPLCFDFDVDNQTSIISVTRFIYNSWPKNISYGDIFKGTFLKAASIDWFAWEEELQPEGPIDQNLT